MMKKTQIAFIMAVLAVLQMQAAFAVQCLSSVDTSTSASRATTGTSVTITVTTSGSSCTVSTLALVSSPSLTVNDPADGQYSGFSAGTTKTFTVTAGSAGNYQYYARGTTTDGSVDSSPQQYLDFISPSDLTVSVSPASASVTNGNTFSLDVNIQNVQTSDVSTSYALNLPSGLTRQSGSPTSSSGTTVSASSTKTLSFTIKHSTCFEGSKSITFDLGGSTGVASVSVTGNASGTCSASSSNASSSTSGGGSTGGAAVVTEAHTFAQITPAAAAVKKFTNAAIALKEISIGVNNPANNVRVTVTKLAGQPASITKTVSGKVFQYVEINASNLAGNIKNAALTFEVTKSWLSSNGFEKSHVVLQRYTGTDWEKLPTAILSEDASIIKYQATTSGFSVFAITAESAASQAAATSNQTQPAQQPANETQQPPAQPAQPSPEQPAQPLLKPPPIDIALTAFIVILTAAAGAIYYKFGRKKEKFQYRYKS